jgi:ribonuclease D
MVQIATKAAEDGHQSPTVSEDQPPSEDHIDDNVSLLSLTNQSKPLKFLHEGFVDLSAFRHLTDVYLQKIISVDFAGWDRQ